VQLEGEEAEEEEEAEAEEEAVALPSKKRKGQKKAKGGPALYELSGDKEAAISITATASSGSRRSCFFCTARSSLLTYDHTRHTTHNAGKRKRDKQSLEERLKSVSTTTDGLKRHTDGAMQLTFVPKTSSKKLKVLPSPPSSPTISSRRIVSRVPVLTCRLSPCVVSCSAGRAQQEARGRRTEPGRTSAEERGQTGQINKNKIKDRFFVDRNS